VSESHLDPGYNNPESTNITHEFGARTVAGYRRQDLAHGGYDPYGKFRSGQHGDA